MRYILLLLCLFSSIARAQSPDAIRLRELSAKLVAKLEENPAQALKIALEIEVLASKLGIDSSQCIAKFLKAEALQELGIFDEAQKGYFQALKLATDNNLQRLKSKILLKVGDVYFAMEDYENALKSFKESKRYAILAGQYVDTLRLNFEIGLNMQAFAEGDEGIEFIKKNIAEAHRQKIDEVDIMYGFDNLWNCYLERGDFENALKYEGELLRYIKNNPRISALKKTAIYQHMSETYLLMKNTELAKPYLDSAYYYARIFNSNNWLYEIYKNYATLYELKGDYKKSLYYQQRYQSAKDSVYHEHYDNKMSAMVALYGLDSKEKAIAILEKDGELKSDKIKLLVLVAGLLTLISLSIIFFIRYKNQEREKKMQELFSQQLLEAQEEERQRLARELHDSVGQNILFIKNQLQKTDDSEKNPLLESVNSALEEVRSISKDLYPNQLEKYGLAAAVDALAENIRSSSGLFVSSDMEGIDEILTKNVKINFYRIIQEFVNNTLKHAKASSIRITAQQNADKIELIVQDNGKGFDKSELERKSQRSFGLLNMEERIKMLKGKVEIESTPGQGTKSTFTVPL